jgi:hypothetical protein
LVSIPEHLGFDAAWAVNYVVKVGYTGGDWPDLLADMRSWLDRRQIEIE